MFRALDAEGNNVLASQAISSETYFCPFCHQELYQRRGTIRIPHFAHKPNVSDGDINRCSDGWGHDTSAWHIDWQLRFPEEFYEKRLEHNGIWHVADIATNQNIIIEFQHSPISIEEFRERNAFYTTCGYRVIWVFDLIKECDMQRLENSLENKEGNEFHWSHVKKPFQDIKVKEECAVIYIQLSDDEDEETGVLERLSGIYKEGRLLFTVAGCSMSKAEFLDAAIKNPDLLFPKQRITFGEIMEGRSPKGKTIAELWRADYEYMIIRNLITKEEILIDGENGAIYREYGRVVGKYTWRGSDSRYHYSKYYTISDADKPIWELKLKKI